MYALVAPRVWPSRLVLRFLAVVFFVGFFVANYVLWTDAKSWDEVKLHLPSTVGIKHPIRKLMIDAKKRHESLIAKRAYDDFEAANRYRARRGRHPPPGFGHWVEAALNSKAYIVEDYFDRIYKDLTPFWALDPATISKQANSWHWVVRVRNGTASHDGNTEGRVPWLQLWTDLVKEFAEHMPDVDMPINYMDEPRLLVPFDHISKLVKKADESRHPTSLDNVTHMYKNLAEVDAARGKAYDPKWVTKAKYWDLAVKTCGPDTPAYGVTADFEKTKPPEFPQQWQPEYAYKGYIQNWTAAMDPCLQPHLRQLHGSFVSPLSLSSTDELIPLFGGSKLPMNNEILIPGAMYLSDDAFYSGGDNHGEPWEKKKNGIIWRGDASGGHAHADNWQHFQRHRLIEMLNGTVVDGIENGNRQANTFKLPPQGVYKSALRKTKQLGSWLSKVSDCAFTHICIDPDANCNHLKPLFKEVPRIPMAEQYKYKFLPDADGNSFSARFRGFMRSTSVPLKATIYNEWHDDRLIPWYHFIPLDNTFQDLYSVLEYFMDENGPGDGAAKIIAEAGQKWAEQALRREDMMLYLWRVLLEWARLCDEGRDTLGWTLDLGH